MNTNSPYSVSHHAPFDYKSYSVVRGSLTIVWGIEADAALKVRDALNAQVKELDAVYELLAQVQNRLDEESKTSAAWRERSEKYEQMFSPYQNAINAATRILAPLCSESVYSEDE